MRVGFWFLVFGSFFQKAKTNYQLPTTKNQELITPMQHPALLAFVLTAFATGCTTLEPLPGTLIVVNKSEASASLLDCGTGAERYRLPVGSGPHEVAVSPDGRTAVVANYGGGHPGHTLTVLDLEKARVLDTINLDPYHRPHGIRFLPDGGRVVVTAEQEQSVIVVDVASGEVVTAVQTDQQIGHMVVLADGGRRAWVSNLGSGSVSVVDLVAAEVVTTIETGPGAEGIDISPDGREVWVGNRAADTLSIIDTATLSIVRAVPCGELPIRVKFTTDGRHVLVSNARSGDVAVFDAASRREVARIAMKAGWLERRDSRIRPAGDTDRQEGPVPVGILIGPDGRRAWVANTNGYMVTVLDLDSWSIAGRLTAGEEPDGMGYSRVARKEQ